MEGYKVFLSSVIVLFIVLPFHVNTMVMMEPDFVSIWYDMKAQAGTNTTLLSIEHGLGETPLLVDVQVYDENSQLIFPGSGCRARDDDQSEEYGGIIYIYNDVYIKVSSPIKGNHFLGRCIYTGFSPYWIEGGRSVTYDSYSAKVRARAWRKFTLPPEDFAKTEIFISSGTRNNYFEVPHGLGDYPALVISRTRFPASIEMYPNFYSDSVGSSMGMYDNTSTQNAFVVYGFSNETIRVWAPTSEADYVFAGSDGWNFNAVKNGTLELYAWKDSSLTPSLSSQIPNNLFRICDNGGQYVKAWVQATSGLNSGFRFVGSGNLAYDKIKTADGCSYGGFLYAYDERIILIWQPGPGNGTSNGALICIANGMGGGKNVQASTDGVFVMHSWDLAIGNSSTTTTIPYSAATSPTTNASINSVSSGIQSSTSFVNTSLTSVLPTDVSSTFSSTTENSTSLSLSTSYESTPQNIPTSPLLSTSTSPITPKSSTTSSTPTTTLETPSTESNVTLTQSTMTTFNDSSVSPDLSTSTTTIPYLTIENTTAYTESSTSTSTSTNSTGTTMAISNSPTQITTTITELTSARTFSTDSSASETTPEENTSYSSAGYTTLSTKSTTKLQTSNSSTMRTASTESTENTETWTFSNTGNPISSTDSASTTLNESSTIYMTSSESSMNPTDLTTITTTQSTESTTTISIDSSTLETSTESLENTTLTPNLTTDTLTESSEIANSTQSFTTETLTESSESANSTPPFTTENATESSENTTLTPPFTTETATESSTTSIGTTTSALTTSFSTSTVTTSPTVTTSSTATTITTTTQTSTESTKSPTTSTATETSSIYISTSQSSTSTTDLTSTPTYSTELSTSTTQSTTAGDLTNSSTSSSSTEQRTTVPTSTHSSTSIITSTTIKPDCGSPPDIPFGNVEANGSVARYVCNPGYKLFGNEFIHCKANGTWGTLSTDQARCLPVDCGNLRLSINNSEETTYIPKNSTQFGSVALIKCKVGYSFTNGNTSATFICSEKATWNSNVSITCLPVYCSRPNVTGHLTILGSNTSYKVDSVIDYSCRSDYILEGYRSRVCLKSGQWSGSAPKCIKAPSKIASPCEKNTDSHGQVWNATNPGETRVFPCSKIKEDLSNYVTRKCSTEGEWLLPHYNCIRKALEEITESVNIIKEKPTTETVVSVLGQLSSLTNQTESNKTYSGELEAVTSTLGVIANINYTNITINDSLSTSFFETTSNLLDTSNTESWQAGGDQSSTSSEAASGASKVLDVISNFTDAISSSFIRTRGGNFSKTFDNLVLEIRSIQNETNIKFPPTGSQNASLDLPEASLTGSKTYSAVLYKNLSGMMSINTAFSGNDIELGSSVMSVKLDRWTEVEGFNITLTFQNFGADQQLSATCSYRNASSVLWGKDGCTVKRSDNNETVCECDHLTNFAILMSPWTKENVETEAIRIISIVGCSISMLCLIITMLTHICYWKFVKSDRVKILMNLCFALLISYSLFLGGVDRTANEDVCTTIAVLLQYVYLVVFFLMLAEAVEIAFVVLYVFTTESRLKWILPLAWLLPAVIVGISLAVTQTKGYGNEKSCWLSIDDGLIWAFVGPALLIILVNFILIVLVLKAIFKTKNLSQKSLKERTIAGIRCLCVLLPLVGCTWVIGIFYVKEDLAWIQYVFAVCNGLQGLAIFIFHCLLNTQIKHAYQRKKRNASSGLFTRSTSNPILIPRAKSNSSTQELYNMYNSINDSYEAETTYHLDRDVRERRPGPERIEMKHYSDRRYQFDEW